MDAAVPGVAREDVMSSAFTTSQQQAIAARGNVIVVAGAGTGKTSTLVQRCIALLESGVSLERILMVTFTEAAAVEMRGRIRDALQEKAAALRASGDRDTLEHFEKQLALLDSAFISTLHSFCMQLVREHFHELGIDPDVSVLDEQQTRPIIHQLLDRMFEAHYAGDSDDDRGVQQLVRVQGRGSDERIRTLILKLHRYSQSLAAPDAWIAAQRELFNAPGPVRWREWFLRGVEEWRAFWLPSLQSHRNSPVVAIALRELENVAKSQNVAVAAAAIRAIQAADDDDANWPRGSKKVVRDPLKHFFEETKFLASIAPRDDVDPLAEDWKLIRHDMLTLLRLTEEFGDAFSRAKREMGGVDFSDLEQFALRVLCTASGEPTDTALRWRKQFEHVFVDEYQDINAAQDAILSALSWPGSAANRFLVGDVKQSIYRFRLADPTIFRRYEREWNAGVHAARISLTENFRCREGVLLFVNRFFAALMRDAIGGVDYEPLQFGAAESREALSVRAQERPRVELNLIVKSTSENGNGNGATGENGEGSDVADLLATEREARLVALKLKTLKEEGHQIWDKASKQMRPVEWSDMAVLLRSPASRVEAFAKEFARLGIPLEAARAGFFESPEVSDLISLLKLLDNPLQDVPLLAVLHSPLVGMTAAELGEIRAAEPIGSRSKFFHQSARRFWTEGRNPADAESNPRRESAWLKLDTFFKQLRHWRELIRHSSVSHCLETALTETHYELLLRASERGAQQLANVRRLIDLAREYDPYQRQGLFRFLRFVQMQEEADVELEPAAVARDAVQLTSIHRSKGLEFPVVALAGIGARFNERDLHENILLDEHFGVCPKVTPRDGEQSYPSLPHWLARRRQFRELCGEELRLLYVAMTRARDTLLLVGTSRRKDDAGWSPEPARILSDKEVLSARSYLDWLRLWIRQSSVGENDREGETELIRWRIIDENASELAVNNLAASGSSVDESKHNLTENGADIIERLRWKYHDSAATGQPAKTTVTELRRQLNEEESETAPFLRQSVFALPKKNSARLGAAETGVAHHRFLQGIHLNDGTAMNRTFLEAEIKRMSASGWLEEKQAKAIDIAAVSRFWESDLGREVLGKSALVRRELPFTFGFKRNDLEALGLQPLPGLGDEETVIVQGVVDLAVLLPEEIWIIDFKTDAVAAREISAKTAMYEPQLRLYAHAISRIHSKPVTRSALYFLATGDLAFVR